MTEQEKREKVIKGLEICSAGEWNSTGGRNHTDCPYYPAGYTGCTCKPLMLDALALLKVQEPVEPTKSDEDNMAYCGACGSPVGYEVLEPPGMDYVRYNYCPECGRAVKWDAQEQREYEAAVEMAEYCKRYEPTYNADDGSM